MPTKKNDKGKKQRFRVIQGGRSVNVPLGDAPQLKGEEYFNRALYSFIGAYLNFQSKLPEQQRISNEDVAVILLRAGVGTSLAVGVPEEELADAFAIIVEQEVEKTKNDGGAS